MEISDRNIASLLLALKNTQLRDEEKRKINTIGWLLSPLKTVEDKNRNRNQAAQKLSDLLNGNSDLYHLFEDYQKRLAGIPDDTLRGFIPKLDDLKANRPDLFPKSGVVEKAILTNFKREKSNEIGNVAYDIFSSADPQETIRSLDLKEPEQISSH